MDTGKYLAFDLMIRESEAYTDLDVIEHYVERGEDLGQLPVQPLYAVFHSLPSERIAQYLPKLSREQRKTFLGLDLWYKDELDVENFNLWVKSYAQCKDDEIRFEFAQSSEFCLFLKGSFSISTFDAEDPEYPDNDNYFLTEDNLLLIEFSSEHDNVDEVKLIIKELYSRLGVEKAYAHLFKLVTDNFSSMQEEEYHLKKEWLRDYGFVDYYDALELDSPFVTLGHIDQFIASKKRITGSIAPVCRQQILHRSALTPYKDEMEDFAKELDQISDDRRRQFLHFNFLRLVNASLTLSDAMKEGPVAMAKTGNNTKARMHLGLSYIKNLAKNNPTKMPHLADESPMMLFDFVDLFKIGNSLLRNVQKTLKKSLAQHQFDGDKEEVFLGSGWQEFLDQSFDWPPTYASNNLDRPKIIDNFQIWQDWNLKCILLMDLLPFANRFQEMYKELVENEILQSAFYLNYTVEEIDFPAIFISSFANHSMGLFNNANGSKMGLSLDEFRLFVSSIMSSQGVVIKTPELLSRIADFQKNFGLDNISGLNDYMIELLKEHLEGYDFEKMKFDDFKHVGGPILLAQLKH
jgi:hypothetical protein